MLIDEKSKSLFHQMRRGEIDYKREILAGCVTFLTMAYIIVVNPMILSAAGMPMAALVTATCLSTAFATILMGVYANMPLALAPGMGLNAFFAFSVVVGMSVPWEIALTATFTEGVIFILLSLSKFREAVIEAIPVNLKHAVAGGVGLFIAFIGFTNSGMVVKNEATMVGLGDLSSFNASLTIIGLIFIVILENKNVKGSILYSILLTSIISWGYALYDPQNASLLGINLPSGFFKYESISAISNKIDFSYVLSENFSTFLGIVFIMLFSDFFNTIGTVVGVMSKTKLANKEGKIPNADKVLLVDAIGTTAGAFMGVSTVTTYVESATGIAQGGKTGITAITTGVLFLLAMLLSPIFISIPKSATAAALIYVGFLMCDSIKNMEFKNLNSAIPSFLTLALIPLTYSIGDGLIIGIIAYVSINLINNLFSKKREKVSLIMLSLSIAFLIKIIYPLFL